MGAWRKFANGALKVMMLR